MRAAKACATPGCPHLAETCPHHQKVPWQGSTRRQTLPKAWGRLRAYILKRDPVCRICRERPSTACDHIRPGGSDSEWNLQGVCDVCHASKSGREGQAARNASSPPERAAYGR